MDNRLDLLAKYLDTVNMYISYYLKLHDDELIDLFGDRLSQIKSDIDIAEDNLSSFNKRLIHIAKKTSHY